MKKPIPFTDEQIQAMCAAYRSGATLEHLAHEYGICASAIRERLIPAGVELRRRGAFALPADPEFKAKAQVLKAKGFSVTKICAQLGVSPTTYYRKLRA